MICLFLLSFDFCVLRADDFGGFSTLDGCGTGCSLSQVLRTVILDALI